MEFKRIPRHVGIIPDGNRRWAQARQKEKQEGYEQGVAPGVLLYEQLTACGVQEATFYGFTKDNTKRPVKQREAFTAACIQAVDALAARDAAILVVGNTSGSLFPQALLPYTKQRVCCGKGLIRINFLINYDWKWDLEQGAGDLNGIASKEISRMELIIRWGGRRRLSGFLPVQSVYADFFVVDDYWPDYENQHFQQAMDWYQQCDPTLGG